MSSDCKKDVLKKLSFPGIYWTGLNHCYRTIYVICPSSHLQLRWNKLLQLLSALEFLKPVSVLTSNAARSMMDARVESFDASNGSCKHRLISFRALRYQDSALGIRALELGRDPKAANATAENDCRRAGLGSRFFMSGKMKSR